MSDVIATSALGAGRPRVRAKLGHVTPLEPVPDSVGLRTRCGTAGGGVGRLGKSSSDKIPPPLAVVGGVLAAGEKSEKTFRCGECPCPRLVTVPGSAPCWKLMAWTGGLVSGDLTARERLPGADAEPRSDRRLPFLACLLIAFALTLPPPGVRGLIFFGVAWVAGPSWVASKADPAGLNRLSNRGDFAVTVEGEEEEGEEGVEGVGGREGEVGAEGEATAPLAFLVLLPVATQRFWGLLCPPGEGPGTGSRGRLRMSAERELACANVRASFIRASVRGAAV